MALFELHCGHSRHKDFGTLSCSFLICSTTTDEKSTTVCFTEGLSCNVINAGRGVTVLTHTAEKDIGQHYALIYVARGTDSITFAVTDACCPMMAVY